MKTHRYRIVALAGLCTILIGCTLLVAATDREPVTPEELRQRARELERREVQQQSQDLHAQHTREALLLKAGQTQKAFTPLTEQAESFFQKAEALLDSDEGKRVVKDPVAFRTFYRLHTEPPVTLTEIETMAKANTALAERLEQAGSGPKVGLLPDEETTEETYRLSFWVGERSVLLDKAVSTLNDLLRTAPRDVDLENAKTLRQAVDDYQALWHKLLSESQILGELQADEEARQIVVDAAYLAYLQQAKADAETLLKEKDAEITRQKQQFKLAMLKQKQEAERLKFESQKSYDDAIAEIQRLKKQADADRRVADINANIKRTAQLDQAERDRRLAEAQSDEVRRLLAPFLVDGYYQPGNRRGTFKKGPVSRSALASAGALSDSTYGLTRLLDYGTDPADKLRPRWPFPRLLHMLTDNQRDQLDKAHKYLIDLSPTLVELKLLAD